MAWYRKDILDILLKVPAVIPFVMFDVKIPTTRCLG